jgi:hypothetical protein
VAVQTLVNRAAVEITCLGQRKRKTPEEAVTALPVDQTTGGKFLAGITEPPQMAAQAGAGRITDTHPLNDSAVPDAAFVKVLRRFRATHQLAPIEIVRVGEQLLRRRAFHRFGCLTE